LPGWVDEPALCASPPAGDGAAEEADFPFSPFAQAASASGTTPMSNPMPIVRLRKATSPFTAFDDLTAGDAAWFPLA
jgi:hypothetical protein